MNRAKLYDVITIGDVFQDIVMTGFPHWPQPGEEIDAQAVRREIGGGAALTACGLARLGMRTAVFACVGASDGEWIRTRLQSCGVDASYLQSIADQPTGLSVAVSTEQDRAFFTHRGANGQLSEELARLLTKEVLSNTRHVHLAFPIELRLLYELAFVCLSADVTISLDVGWNPAWLKHIPLRRALLNVDLFFPNEREAALMTRKKKPEQMLQVYVEKRFPAVILKLGAQGSAMLHTGKYLAVEAFNVQPVDTTGAGDCFDAGFLYGWLNDKPLLDCLRIGNFCGAQSTQALGGVTAFPTLETLRAEGLA